MNTKRKFEERIKRKEEEIQEYELKIKEAKIYIQALQDAIKFLPKENMEKSPEAYILRPGSNMSKTYEILQKTGKPMHINDILSAIGKNTSKKERVSLAGSIANYARKKRIFVKTGPNTFGLYGMEEKEEPPEDFGIDNKEDHEEFEKIMGKK